MSRSARRRASPSRSTSSRFEENCLSCHNPEKAKGDWIAATKKEAFESGENAPNIVPFDVKKSAIYGLCALDAEDEDLMPPKKSGGPLPKEQITFLKLWIEQGAPWPDDAKLKAKEKKPPPRTIRTTWSS